MVCLHDQAGVRREALRTDTTTPHIHNPPSTDRRGEADPAGSGSRSRTKALKLEPRTQNPPRPYDQPVGKGQRVVGCADTVGGGDD